MKLKTKALKNKKLPHKQERDTPQKSLSIGGSFGDPRNVRALGS